MNARMMPAKHSAPGQYLGYALQPLRAFYYLLTCPNGALVSLEFGDDVAVHFADGSLLLEQCKSAIRQNPISDWSVDLWKTIDNWNNFTKHNVAPGTAVSYHLYVTPKHDGKIAKALNVASSSIEVAALVKLIRSRLCKIKEKPACFAYLAAFLDETADQQALIVKNISIESNQSDPLDALRVLLAPVVHPEHIDLLCKAGVGIAKQSFDRLIQRNEVAIINGNDFKREFGSFLRKNLMPNLLSSLGQAPAFEELTNILALQPIFIRQLQLIEARDEDNIRAISDYLRTSADKADWAERGLIFPGSLQEWDEALVHRHSLISGDVADLHSDKPAATRGRLTYRQCAMHQAPLEGRSVPSHFVHGSFNDLADRKRIGWHPAFIALLGGEEE